MPSIRELFTDAEIDQEGANGDLAFDFDALMTETERALKESTRMQIPDQDPEGGEPSEVPAATETPEAPPEVEPGATESPAPSEAPEGGDDSLAGARSADPLGLLPPERQAALLALDQVFQADPTKHAAVLRTLSETPAPAAAYTPPPLPDEIDPDSFEAKLWNRQSEYERQLAEMGTATKNNQEAFAKQSAAAAAERAGANFEARYAGKLDHTDVMAIARHAGATGIAARFANGADDLTAAYDQALETALWTNEGFRAKAMGAPAPLPPAAEPEAIDRKRKLTSLSSSASPVSGPPPAKTPLQSRTDGRLTPESRLSVVKDLATGLARQNNEGTF